MRVSQALLSGALAGQVVEAKTCCRLIDQKLDVSVSFPGHLEYNATEASYWSLQESQISPACIVYPTCVREVSQTISLISSIPGCEFAIKGQGHSPAAGFANVENGVTIDMTGLATVVVNPGNTIASVGAGSSWLQVYRTLEALGLAAVGGRNGLVGVGGLLVGGGISHFSARKGWAADNVVNYEIVLGDGSIIDANKSSHSDLFTAMRGGGNNFGVVTRFDLAVFPQGNISVTALAHDISQREAVFEAFTELVDAPNFDPDASLVTGLLYSSASKQWSLTNSAVYTIPVSEPSAYRKLSSIPSISNSTSITSLAVFADESPTPPLNWLFATSTFKSSAHLMRDIFTQLNTTLAAFNPTGGVTWSISFEPLAGALLSGSQENVLGVSFDHKGFVLLLSALWPNDQSRDTIQRVAHDVLFRIESGATAKGLLQRFRYLNYAAPYQKPLESYGEKNIQFLRTVRKTYDPRGIFTTRVKGGFKL